MFGIITLMSLLGTHPANLPAANQYNAKSISQALEEHLPVVGQCYALHVAPGRRDAHRLKLHFTIAADGTIADAQIIHDGLPRGTASCIRKDIKSWQLPAPGSVAELEYTFLFR